MSNVDFHFVVPLWGEKYAEEFIQVTLPNQLSPGNLGAFRGRSKGDKYIIYTRRKDAAFIQNSDAFAKLNAIMQTEFHYIDHLMEDVRTRKINKYDVMTICHAEGLENAKQANAAIIPIPCDVVFSDGSFENMLKLTLAGKRLIVIGSTRVSSETFNPAILEQFYDAATGTIPIKSRDLVRLALSHIHPASKALFVDAKDFLNPSPAYLYWMVEGEGILERGIHLQPMMINPSDKKAALAAEAGMGIDGYDFMQRAVPDYNDVHVVTDTDEITYFSFCETEPGKYNTSDFNLPYVSWWIKNYCCDYHLDFMDLKIRMHTGEIGPKWAEVEKRSDELVARLHQCLDYFDKEPGAYNGVDSIIRMLQNKDKQIATLRDQLRLVSEDDAVMHNRYGMELYHLGRKDEAEKLIKKAITISGYYTDAYVNLAHIYKEKKDFSMAIRFMKGALTLQPNSVALWVILGEISLAGGMPVQVKNCLNKALTFETDSVNELVSLAELAIKSGDFEIMDKVHKKIARVAPAHAINFQLHQKLNKFPGNKTEKVVL